MTGSSSGRGGPVVGDSRAGERHVVELLERRLGVDDAVVLRLARLTLRAASAGHSCLDLSLLDAGLLDALDARRSARDVVVGARDDRSDDETPLPGLEVALAALRASSVVHVVAAEAGPSDGLGVVGPRPFVLDGTRLSTQREHAAEQRLIAALARRAVRAPEPVPVAPTGLTEDPGQIAAVAALADAGVRAGVGVLAGGPGTGKTTTIAALLAVRMQAHLALQAEAAPGAVTSPLRIALAAPTGKAAARLTESLRAALPRIAVVHGESVARQLGLIEATTVHRLLGIGRAETRRDGSVLPHDLIVIDEASMLALPLAAELLGALEDRSQLVLVGDPDQLESVETGSVLRALVDTLEDDGGPLARLTRNHRLAATDAAADRLARAVRDGDADTAVALLRDAGGAGVSGSLRFVATDDPARHAAAVIEPLLDDGEGGGLLAALRAAEVGDGAGALAALSGARLLCAHRHGPYGASRWAERLRAQLAVHVASGGAAPGDVWLPGEPVMVLANDDRTGLVNGDTGVAIGRGGTRRLVFERRDGTLLERPAEVLPAVVSAYAVTVHKSQGSEYGTVVVVLPPPGSPLATRELLYTAVTRAKRRVVIVGDESSVRAAIGRPSVRMGGLVDGLARALPASSTSG
jgi:exodeoxyribonuclease V alpha subunit